MADVSRSKTFWAFAAIYLIWGSTYLAIQIAVHDIPPFFLAGFRFLVAGALLYGWARLHGEPAPTAATWRWGALLGTLFFVFGNGLVVWAEQTVPSGRTALLASTSPIWTVMIESALAGWQRPPVRIWLGVVLGFAGLLLLARPTPELADTVPTAGLLALIGAGLTWSLGSVFSHRRHLDGSPVLVTAIKMLGGGLQLMLVSVVFGEWRRLDVGAVGWQAWSALVYLIVFGSIIGFTAFTYLLRASTPQRVATSAYVNPVVALFLGWLIASEVVTSRMLIGAAVILAGVVLVRLEPPPDAVDPAEAGAT